MVASTPTVSITTSASPTSTVASSLASRASSPSSVAAASADARTSYPVTRPPDARRDLRGMDADAAQPDDRDPVSRTDPAPRHHRPVRRADRARHGRGMHGVDRRRHRDQPLDGHGRSARGTRRDGRTPSTRSGRCTAGPSRAGTQGTVRRASTGRRSPSSRWAAGPGGFVSITSPNTSWPGTCGSASSVAERHPSTRRLHVREADPTGEHLQQRLPGSRLEGPAGRSAREDCRSR